MRVVVGMSEKLNQKINPLSSIIKDVEGTPGSHMYLCFPSISEDYVYEAVFPQVRRISKKEWLKQNRIVEEISLEIKNSSVATVQQFLLQYLGKPYSILQLFVIYATKLNAYIARIFIKNNLNKGRALICSEFIARFLSRFFGVDFGESFDTIGLKEVWGALLSLAKQQEKIC